MGEVHHIIWLTLNFIIGFKNLAENQHIAELKVFWDENKISELEKEPRFYNTQKKEIYLLIMSYFLLLMLFFLILLKSSKIIK
jgi:hypothetical protein